MAWSPPRRSPRTVLCWTCSGAPSSGGASIPARSQATPSTAPARTWLASKGWAYVAYVAIPNFDFRDTGLFGPGHFRYDPEKDVYVCPADERLHRRTRTGSNRGTRYRANAEACNACELKAKCTTSERGRMLYRPFEIGRAHV